MFHIHRSKPSGNRYGWIPDIPDHRDLPFSLVKPRKVKLPPVVDLRLGCTPIENQESLGSCTANALVGCLEYLDNTDGDNEYVDWSRLFLYYNERAMRGWENEDSGAFLRDGIKSLAKDGICSEKSWPYVINRFDKKPGAVQYGEASLHTITSYYRISSLDEMLACLASGFPFVFGFTVYESFESPEVARTGIVPMPKKGEKSLGGHAVTAIGYDMKDKWFRVRNSWGEDWGNKGTFCIPFAYLENDGLASDFWYISKARV